MEPLSVSIDLKPFANLLIALSRKIFPTPGEPNITDEDIIQSIYRKAYSDLDSEEISSEISLFESILSKAAQDNWTPESLSDFLLKRDFPNEYCTVFVEFWRRESSQIHSKLLRQVTYNSTLDNMSWRVDMKALTKNSAETNVPLAYFDLNLVADNKKEGSSKHTVKFEMSREEVANMVDQLNKIQETYEKLVAK